jgi:antitoxin YxxD
MFDLFKQYITNPEQDSKDQKHSLYAIRPNSINQVEVAIKIPNELKKFYQEIGYGFFHNSKGSINRLLSPLQLKQLNLREDFYEFDPELDSYEERYSGLKMLFFEINEGIYLAIDKEDSNERNAIYFFDKKISDSLENFLIQFDQNPHLLDEFHE